MTAARSAADPVALDPSDDSPRGGDIKRAAAQGGIALAGRQVLTLVANLVTGIFLARLLDPGQFGALALLLLIVNFGKVFVDLGLSASLIQQSTKPSEAERSAIFGLEWIVAAVTTAAVLLVADPLCDLANARPGTAMALRVAALSLLSVPVVSIVGCALERRLDFQRQGALLAIQPVVFGLSSVPFALAGFGVMSLGLGLLISNVATMLAAIAMRQPIPAPSLKLRSAVPHIRFGIPYMGVTIVSSIKDSVIPLLIGALIGATAVGYVTWAQQVAVVGSYALFVLARLLLPLFARLAPEPAMLASAVSRTLFAANLVVAPISLAVAVFADDIVHVLYGQQWLAAVPLLYLLMAANLIAPTSTVLLALMSAIGRPNISLVFACIWLVTTWLFVAVLTPSFGFLGYGIANVGVQLFALGLIVVARRHVRFSWLRPIGVPWGLATVAFAVPAALNAMLVHTPSFVSLVLLGLLGLAVFAGLTWLVSRRETLYLVDMFRRR